MAADGCTLGVQDSRLPRVLHRFRQSSRLSLLLVLALCAGPAASALCPHPGEEDHSAMAGTMEKGAMPEMEHGTHEAPPCHEEAPAEAPESADCFSPCCTAAPEAPAPTPPAPLAASASAALAVAVSEAEPCEAAPPVREPEPPPAPPLRVHLLLERFQT